MTTPAPPQAASRHDRPLSSFPPAARATLSAGGTVVGGNGATYKLNPATGIATVTRWGAAADTSRGVPTPAERAENGPRTVTDGSPREDVPAASGPTQAQRDARDQIMVTLNEYGLGSLADFVWTQILEGKSAAEIERDIRKTPEFQKRFPAIAERTKRGLAPLSPGEYVSYERQAYQIMRAAGLPEQFYDTPDDFATFLAGDVSISELNDRIQLGKQAAYEAPQDVRDALMRDYGITEGGLTAFFLDPDKAQPLLEKQWRAAQIGGAGRRTGFNTSREENERLAALGITGQQAQEGFGALTDSAELFTSLDRTEDRIGRDEQLGAAFEGNAAARRRIEQRRRKRLGVFEQGGSVAAGQTGLVGLAGTDD